MSTEHRQCVLAIRKRGRSCVVGKLVRAHPSNRLILAVVFRHRRSVERFVSVPIAALQYARAAGATELVVRFDRNGRCLSLPFDQVEARGFLRLSSGVPEWFIRLTEMKPVPWVEWPYILRVVALDRTDESDASGGIAA